MDDFRHAIETAKSLERLEFLARLIQEDKRDKHEWTQDDDYLQELRIAWGKRRNSLTQSSRGQSNEH